MAISYSCSLNEHGNCRRIRGKLLMDMKRYGYTFDETDPDSPALCKCSCHDEKKPKSK